MSTEQTDFMKTIVDKLDKLFNCPSDDMWDLMAVSQLSPSELERFLSENYLNQDSISAEDYQFIQNAYTFFSQYVVGVLDYANYLEMTGATASRADMISIYWGLPTLSREELKARYGR